MPDAPHDPMDKAYVQAEAMLSDEAERAARRARVLAAVAQAAQAAPEAEAPKPRPAWGRGGWLVAASVAGVSVLLATQIRPPIVTEPPPAPTAEDPAVPSGTVNDGASAPPRATVEASAATPKRTRQAAAPLLSLIHI